jgi:hypothetical protein
MAAVRFRATVTSNRLPQVARQLDHLGATWAQQMADHHEAHHHQEAPVGQRVFIDAEGNQHPGWLRDSLAVTPLPDGGQWLQVEAFYGIYVNSGTRFQAPNPFWDRALLRTEALADITLEAVTAQMLARVRL